MHPHFAPSPNHQPHAGGLGRSASGSVGRPAESDYTREELRSLHQRSTAKGLALFAAQVSGFVLSSLAVVLSDSWLVQVPATGAVGLFIALMFVVGHDACHQSLTPNRWLNRLLGTLSFLPSLHPYSLWDLWHNRVHHRYTNIRRRDYAWEPLTPAEYRGLSESEQRWYRFYRTLPGHVWYYFMEIWLPKKCFPRARLLGGYRKEHVLDLLTVSLWCAAWPVAAVLTKMWATGGVLNLAEGARIVALACVIPFFIFQAVFSTIIYLHHTHPLVEWFDTDDAPGHAELQKRSSVHVEFPRAINWIFHCILDHTAHHLRPGIPMYNLPHGQSVIEDHHPGIVVQPWSLAFHLRTLRTCKLYDLERRCWTDYEGVPTTRPLVRTPAVVTPVKAAA